MNIKPVVLCICDCSSEKPHLSVDSSLGKNCPEQYSELANVGDVNSSAGLNAARKLIASLYDLKKKFVSCHKNLNKFIVKLTTCKDTNLVRLPPSEPSLYQHVLRASLQTKIWLSSNIAKPPPVSLWLRMAERCSWTTACILWRDYDFRFSARFYLLLQRKSEMW